MNQSLQIAGISIVSAAVGLAVGYKVAEKRLAAQFEERLERETAEMKTFYQNVKKPYSTPEEAVADLIPQPETVVVPAMVDPREKAQKVQYNKIVKTEEYVAVEDESEEGAAAAEEELIHQNIFESVRDTENPYIISEDDFMGNETGYEQATLTFYVKGGVLADEREDVIDDMTNTTGNDFPSRFGSGSDNENVVYIRNEKLQMEFEVLKSDRSYEEDVLGMDQPPESPRNRLRREG
jgi:hypothetical protein